MARRRWKYLIPILAVVVITAGIAVHNDQEERELRERYPRTEPYVYPYNPDMEEWSQYNIKEMTDLLEIPDGIVEEMPVDTLIDTVLTYPYISVIASFTKPLTPEPHREGVKWIEDHNKAMVELFTRPDALKALQKRLKAYENGQIQDGREELNMYFLEIMITHIEVNAEN